MNPPDIGVIRIFGTIEGHVSLAVAEPGTKATAYETVLNELTAMQLVDQFRGVLVLVHTIGGDVDAGLAIAETIASLGKPTVAVILGSAHSIGLPIAVAADVTYAVPSATMVVHPIALNGPTLGVAQTFEQAQRTQDRLVRFVQAHTKMDPNTFLELTLETKQLVGTVGTMLTAEDALKHKLIDAVAGIADAVQYLKDCTKEA